MEESFWLERWQAGKIGFHLSEVNPYLLQHFPKLAPTKESCVLVPLSGKSLDILWLASKVEAVIGEEISPQAVEDFFTENSLTPTITVQGKLTKYQAENIIIFLGDFFALKAHMLPEIDIVFDRAALIALPAKMRTQYANHLRTLLPPYSQILLITLNYPQAERPGPPFAVPTEEVYDLYGKHYTIAVLESVDLQDKNEIISHLPYSFETVYLLQPQ